MNSCFKIHEFKFLCKHIICAKMPSRAAFSWLYNLMIMLTLTNGNVCIALGRWSFVRHSTRSFGRFLWLFLLLGYHHVVAQPIRDVNLENSNSHQFVGHHFTCRNQFDCTCGYEGEGPWTLASVNVGSFEKHQHILDIEADAIAIQETRHTRANQRELSFKAHASDKEIHWGPPMKFNSNGQCEWGGVAIVNTPGTSRILEAKEDASKHFHSLLATNRVVFSWATINSSHSILIANVYCFSGAQCDPAKHVANDNILRQVFELVAQFGNIPIAICGDLKQFPIRILQSGKPLHVGSSLTLFFLKVVMKWTDPLLFVGHENGTMMKSPKVLLMPFLSIMLRITSWTQLRLTIRVVCNMP